LEDNMARKWRGSLPSEDFHSQGVSEFCRFGLPIGLPMFPVS
jgi:hypothetical protein